MADNKLNEMIGVTLEKIKELAGTETVIGEPIYTKNDTVIIPVSKVSMGFASGGVDYAAKAAGKESATGKDRFGGAGGTGVTVTPIAFLILSPEGKIDLVPIAAPQNVDTVDKVASLIERSPDILQKIKNIFTSKKKKKDKSAVKSESADAQNNDEDAEEGEDAGE